MRPAAFAPRRPGHRIRRLLGAGLCAVAAAASLSGCAATRAELGLSDGLCYVALPPAKAAVHGEGSVIGFRLRRVSDLRAVHPLSPVPTADGVRVNGGTRLCLVAFEGRFTASAVRRPRGRTSGPVAVVVLTYPGNRLLGTLILDRPPLPFGHSHPEV